MKIRITDKVILNTAGAVAHVIEVILRKLIPLVKEVEMRVTLEKDCYEYKRKRLHDDAFFHYFDLMKINPTELAYDLASKDLKDLERNNRVEKVYNERFVKR